MAEKNDIGKRTLTGMIWSFFERVGAQIVSFIVSIVLARVLMPSDYGIIATVLVFLNICNVFITAGIGQALVQKKEASEVDYSSIFYLNFGLSIVLYVLLFSISPSISRFYEMGLLSPILRVLGINLFFATFNTVQRAIVARKMQFKKYFYSTISGTLISACIGIWMAYHEFGVWSLVVQNLSNTIINTVVLFFIVKWFPKLVFSWVKAKSLLSYGWKLLVANLTDVIYEDFRSLYVGKLYSPEDLAYYTRGRQFPTLAVDNINTSISTVLLPVLSQKQDDKGAIKQMTRRAIKTSSFLLLPIMFGMAAVADPLVRILLTEKWIACVPFLKILCFNCALMPIQTANIQAINAMGRTDVTLKCNIIKKTLGFLIILISASYSVIAMAWGGVLIGIIASIINAYPNKDLMNYDYLEQLKDIAPCVVASLFMSLCVWTISLLDLDNLIIKLIFEVIFGIVSYFVISKFMRIDSLDYVIQLVMKKNK